MFTLEDVGVMVRLSVSIGYGLKPGTTIKQGLGHKYSSAAQRVCVYISDLVEW